MYRAGWYVVELRTERLILRQWRDSDLDALSVIDGDPEVMRYIGDGTIRNRLQTAEALDRFRLRWSEQGFGLFAAEVAETGILAGWVGLAVPAFLPEVMPSVEIGWRLARSHWGHGYATEGAAVVIADAFGRCQLEELVSIRHVDNAGSARVMDKLGFTEWRRTIVPTHQRPVVVSKLLRSDRPSPP